MFSSRLLAAGAVVVMAHTSADAAYMLKPLSESLNTRTVEWNEAFNLDIVITSDTSNTLSSAIFQVRFTRHSLLLEGYESAAPYMISGIFDDATPSEG